MLVLVAAGFLCCWIPMWVFVLWFRFFPETSSRISELLVTFLFYLSASINPIIYAFTNGEFRREFRKLLCCRRERSRIVPKKAAAFTGNDLVEREEQGADFLSLMNLCWWNIIFEKQDRKVIPFFFSVLLVPINHKFMVMSPCQMLRGWHQFTSKFWMGCEYELNRFYHSCDENTRNLIWIPNWIIWWQANIVPFASSEFSI